MAEPKRDFKKTETSRIHSGLGKLPPQATDIEEVILGALMLEKVSLDVWNSLKPEYFYSDANMRIYAAIEALREERTPVDIRTVTAKLRSAGELEMIGGAYYITELTSNVSSSANIHHHIKIIHQLYISRAMIKMSSEAVSNLYSGGDPFAEMNSTVTQIDQLKRNIFKRSERNMGQLMIDVNEERYREKKNGLLGTSCGFKGIDYVCQGDQEGQLIIIAARPAMGKTAFMCSQMASSVFDFNKGVFLPIKERIPVGCFSLEMPAVQLGFRILSSVSEVDNRRIKKNQLTQQEGIRVDEFGDKLSDIGLYVDDTPGLTIDEFETKAALWVAMYGVKKIYIDYLQLMKGRSGKKYGNREAEVSDISRSLKIVAKELGITIIALCQLSRTVESRKLCKPILSDLRESGSIEQDADIVIFLWRPEYYPEVMKELEGDGKAPGGLWMSLFGFMVNEFKDAIIAIVAKCREEETGNILLKFRGSIMRVCDHPLTLYAIEEKRNNEITLFNEQEADF
jgi:replicative DNA helicase